MLNWSPLLSANSGNTGMSTSRQLPDGSTRHFIMNAMASAEKIAQAVLWDFCVRDSVVQSSGASEEGLVKANQTQNESNGSKPAEIEI